ncbi:hypothetical protein EN828_24075 [Mesorhizobium sp. M2D.F.Ca.ET.185.01.1.1]|uniref:hypothetical protein n=1 Tax=unclassified Mesorhizobium TaxID=325217 RepID=UPI000FCAE0C1|nr:MULTISPECIES: hypothetical protein [unclassified Mesorhizobium]TGP75625.1 hypothetical protein EN870_23165 [bacterium M00.F.Ca.ET.227.01.1.1]TGP87106.1 hypothetical protein EN864_22930 [bacterium M00.F.Ca.ET.221.01.1.1]TGP91598.1 hypothetical protein EN865_21600 [bacterium M00.F.Ca.ET.222.01.1.1]TGU04148.1 hypothetical protein EN806_40555 [bacterium M00.F.Ca.ET.163.01.1.1]TGU23348.1 hypothetical protein EN799_50550 [bacterium M00.F.Ca.ET.156.01.1.1]TGU44357.1 hypothetical protein EN789_230
MLKKAVEDFRRTRGVQFLLGFRHEILYRQFLGSAASKGHAFAESLSGKPERNYCFTIAFNTPWIVDVLTKAWQMFPTGTRLVVIDNSPKQDARASIEAICARRGVAYFRLPRNLETNPSRSHGISQTWVFHNIVKHLKPDMFGFIDHDCFPIGPIDIAKRVGRKIGYGAPLHARSSYLYEAVEDEPGWYYWAGLCFYNFAAVEHAKLDFRNRLDIGMDTGGGNWPVLYSKHAIGEFEMAKSSRVAVSVGGTVADYQLYDEVLFHVGGASYRSGVESRDYRRLLSDHIWKTYLGGTQDRLVSI